MKDYQTILNGFFICGVPAVNTVIENENIEFIVDLRAEVQGTVDTDQKNRVLIPLVDGVPNQSHLLREAIQQVIKAYQEGKKVLVH